MKMDDQVRSRLENVQASLEHVISEANGLVTQCKRLPTERNDFLKACERLQRNLTVAEQQLDKMLKEAEDC